MKRFIKLLFIAIVGTMPLSVVHAQRQTTQETLIRNATVLTVTRGTLTNTDVLIRNGKIAGVGKNLNAQPTRASSTAPASSSCRASSTPIPTRCSTPSTKAHWLLLRWCERRCAESNRRRSLPGAGRRRDDFESVARLGKSDRRAEHAS